MLEFNHPIHWAEAILLATGIILLINLLIRLTRGRRWDEVTHIPPPKPNDITPIDAWLALALYLLVPGLISHGLGQFFPNAIPTSQPVAVENTPTEKIVAGTLSMSLIATGLLLVGRRPFKSFAAWGLAVRDVPRFIGPAFLAYVMVWPICALLLFAASALLTRVFPQLVLEEHSTILLLISGRSMMAKILLVTNAMILAPLTEELFFRGIVLPFLRSITSAWTAIIISGVFFGLFHYPLWQFMLPLAFFGTVLGYLYARTNSLVLVILVHLIFNAKTLLWLALGGGQL